VTFKRRLEEWATRETLPRRRKRWRRRARKANPLPLPLRKLRRSPARNEFSP
jgi:hypothetical protein